MAELELNNDVLNLLYSLFLSFVLGIKMQEILAYKKLCEQQPRILSLVLLQYCNMKSKISFKQKG